MAPDGPATDVAQLVAEHHAAVYRYAFRLTGSTADAEDLTQQVFLTAYQKGWQVREAQSVRNWLYTVLRNCFLKSVQKRQPVPAVNLKLNLDSIPEEVPEAQEIDSEQLQEALNGLQPHYRLVVAMFYFEGLAYREIAEELKLPIGTVMSRLARAKSHLRAALFDLAPEGPTERKENGKQKEGRARKPAPS